MSDNGFAHLERLLLEIKDSLENEMRESAARIERAVKRHSSMIVAGTAAIAGLEQNIQAHDERIAEIERRLRARGL